MSQFPQLAMIALQVMEEASVKADDQSLAGTLRARQMLHGIVQGTLLVSQAPSQKPAPAHSKEEVPGQIFDGGANGSG